MPRANRITCAGLVWHITQRCHERAFLLKFRRDRRRWIHWLWVARRRYGLSVLNFIVTSNHVHLLVRDRGRGEIMASMQLIAGRTAQEYNQRKHRHGAFWGDRYHATAVQTGQHLCRCLVYIDLNMVRAGVVEHPGLWPESGYVESVCPPARKSRLDYDAIAKIFDVRRFADVMAMRDALIAERIACGGVRREPAWTESVAVGDEDYLRQTKKELGEAGRYRQISGVHDKQCLKDGIADYLANISNKMSN